MKIDFVNILIKMLPVRRLKKTKVSHTYCNILLTKQVEIKRHVRVRSIFLNECLFFSANLSLKLRLFHIANDSSRSFRKFVPSLAALKLEK